MLLLLVPLSHVSQNHQDRQFYIHLTFVHQQKSKVIINDENYLCGMIPAPLTRHMS